MERVLYMNDIMTVEELIKELEKIEDKSLPVQLTTGHEDKGRFYGTLYRVSIKENYEGKRVLLTGELEEEKR